MIIWLISLAIALAITNAGYVIIHNSKSPWKNYHIKYFWFLQKLKYFLPIKTKEASSGVENTIKFKDFLRMYQINPQKWNISGTYVTYSYKSPDKHIYQYGSSTDLYFTTYYDLGRFLRWKKEQAVISKKQENQEQFKINQGKYMAAIEDMQQDIEKRKKEIEQQQKESLKQINNERAKNEKRFIDLISNKDLSFTSTEDTSLQLKPLSCNCINIMYQGDLCELFSEDRTGDIYVKMPDNSFALLRDLTPLPSIYFKEEDAHLLRTIEEDLNKV